MASKYHSRITGTKYFAVSGSGVSWLTASTTAKRKVMTRNRTRPSQLSQSLVFCVRSIPDPFLATIPTRNRTPICTQQNKPTRGFPLQRAAGSRHCPKPGTVLVGERSSLAAVGQLADQREQRQVHRYDHSADHNSQEYDHDRLEQCQQIFHGSVDFSFVEVGNLLQHGVH